VNDWSGLFKTLMATTEVLVSWMPKRRKDSAIYGLRVSTMLGIRGLQETHVVVGRQGKDYFRVHITSLQTAIERV
jgi:hypothetical protein